ncbi:MAG: sulfite exporter TauE/SafE family protein [Roseovarius sp.]
MTLETVVFLVLGAAAGGFINGLAGTGSALFALGFYLVVLDPVSAVAVIALMAVLTGAQGLWLVREQVVSQRTRVLHFVVPGLFGVPLGLMLLDHVDASTLRLAAAVLLIVYGGYFGFRAVLPTVSKPAAWSDALIGLSGGILGGMAGLSGALPTLWLSLRPWPKQVTRAVLQSFNMVILVTTVVLLVFKGAYGVNTIYALFITIPAGLMAAQLGLTVYNHLSTAMFRRLLVLMSLMMGLGLLLGEMV